MSAEAPRRPNRIHHAWDRAQEIFLTPNDSPARKALTITTLATLAWTAREEIDRNPALPTTIFTGHTSDFFGSAAIAALNARFLPKNWPIAIPVTTMLVGGAVSEKLQDIHVVPGTGDFGDFVAFLGGAALWLGIDRGIKAIDTRIKKSKNKRYRYQ